MMNEGENREMSKIYISQRREKHQINKDIYGHFAEHLGRCIYEGFWVGEDSDIPNQKGIRLDVVEALKELNIPVLRWPGGCFADEYHWKDGIGPREDRKTIVNTHWGGVVENNHFGTHEFFDLIEMLGCDAYVNGNVGSGTVQELQEWVEYITFDGESPMANERRKNGRDKPWKMKYFGVGNESWGCGGNMRPEFYADEYRRYQTYVRNYNSDAPPIYKIACGPNVDDYNWTEVLMRNAGYFMNGLTLHHYALASVWENKRPATGFPEEEWHSLIESAWKMDDFITKHSTIMDKFDPEKRVDLIVDEWGSWFAVEPGTNPGFLYQQNTIRDAMVAAITLHIFHRHGDRVSMANIAQTINVLQSMILTEGEKMIKTPTFHVFEMFKGHQDGMLLDTFEENVAKHVTSSVSKKDGKLTISICNYGLKEVEELDYVLEDGSFEGKNVSADGLIGDKMDAHNTFENPEQVKKTNFEDFKVNGNGLKISVPPMSVVTVTVE